MAGGGGQTSTQTTTQQLSKEQKALLAGVIPIATDILKPGAVQQYPNSAISPTTPAEEAARQMMLQTAGQTQGFTQNLPSMMQGVLAGQAGNITETGQNAATGQQDLMQMLNMMLQGTTGQIQSGNAQTQPALSTLLNPDILNASSNPYLQSYMEAATRPLTDQYNNEIMPGIAGDAIQAGGFGGSRHGIAQGLAAQGLSRSTGDVNAKIASEGYGQGLTAMTGGINAANTQQGQNLDALSKMFATGVGGINTGNQNQLAASTSQSQTLSQMMQGLSLSPDILASMTKPAEMVSAVGAQQRAEEQALLSEQVQKFISGQMLPFTLAQDVAAMAFGMPGGSSTSTGTTSGGGPGPLQIGASVASALPALLGLFGLSDKRLKQDIVKVGKLEDGLNVYQYSFKHDPRHELCVGLMADEVQEKYPDAVLRDTDGWLRVNYSLVPTWE